MKLAHGVAIVHAVGLVLMFLFSVLVWLYPKSSWYFLTTLLVLFATWPVFKGCPLTRLENLIRQKVRPDLVYVESCVVHYAASLGMRIPKRTPLVVMSSMIVNAVLACVRSVL